METYLPIAKIAQILGNFLCFFKNLYFNIKTAFAAFWATLVKIGPFYFLRFVTLKDTHIEREGDRNKSSVRVGSGLAQLAEWSLPIPEDPGSNPVIGNFY